MDKNWIGNNKSAYTTLGASNHSIEDRQLYDYYATDPKCLDDLFDREIFSDNIWECACGEGHLSKRMIVEYNKKVYSSDIINRGYGEIKDFLCITNQEWEGDIITNPPYKYAYEFIDKSLKVIPKGYKVAMFLKVLFLEGQKRKKFFNHNPPKVVYVYSKRQMCAKNGEFEKYKSNAIAYAWYVWEKGYKGDTIIKWI
tara:strand:+ start:930 stop:1523 length:594 start_codon:yes stop_codon:yes gene_type:complete